MKSSAGHPSVAVSVSGALRADDGFFLALRTSDLPALDRLLDDEFVLVDVFGGATVYRHEFIGSVASGLLRFDEIEVAERATRRFGDTAVVIGRTRMAGSIDGTPFEVASRYTHVLTRVHGGVWRLVSAQGTRIADQPEPGGDAW
jgi:ketosteroid isomerase-like protein